MGVFRKVSKGAGMLGGAAVGGAVKLAGKAAGTKFSKTGKYIEEVGDGVYHASKTAGDNLGQFVDGAVQTGYGYASKKEEYKASGWNDLKSSTSRTWKGVSSTAKYTAKNVGHTYKGAMNGDQTQVLEGVKNIGKVAAVAGLAVGIIDFVDGETVVAETDNDHLAGDVHPETGVPFYENTVTLPDGTEVKGVFPDFQESYEVQLPENQYLDSDYEHFQYANDALSTAISENPSLGAEMGLTESDLHQLAAGETPDGYTWHHHEEPGVLQLVDEETHANTGHTGGRFIWGGGMEHR